LPKGVAAVRTSLAELAWPQRTALVLGALLVVWGLVDFARGAPALGLLHLLTGLAMGAAAVRTRTARLVGTLMAPVFLVVFAFGVGEDGAAAMDAGVVGNALHLLVAFAAVAVAESCAWCEQRARRAARPG
jgi:apolipoprotein N-acyltransferase